MVGTLTPPSPHHLAVDIGNTAVKIGLLSRDAETTYAALAPTNVLRLPTLEGDWSQLASWLPRESARWSVASVNRAGSRRLAEWIALHRPADAIQPIDRAAIDLPVQLDAPDKVGIDRLLAAFAASRLRAPSHNAIVVNCGTAITVDLVDQGGVFRGGTILPGPALMARSLHEHTDALPLVELSDAPPPAVLGLNTAAAIQSGIHFGIRGAIHELVKQVEKKAGGQSEIYLAAAHLKTFAPDRPCFLTPFLVLAGINLVARADNATGCHA